MTMHLLPPYLVSPRLLPRPRFASEEILQGNFAIDQAYVQELLQKKTAWIPVEKRALKMLARFYTPGTNVPRLKTKNWAIQAAEYELALQIYEKFKELEGHDFYGLDRQKLHKALMDLYRNRLVEPEKAKSHEKKLKEIERNLGSTAKNDEKEHESEEVKIQYQLQEAEKAFPLNEDRITELLTSWYKLLDPWKDSSPLPKRSSSVKVRTNWFYLN